MEHGPTRDTDSPIGTAVSDSTRTVPRQYFDSTPTVSDSTRQPGLSASYHRHEETYAPIQAQAYSLDPPASSGAELITSLAALLMNDNLRYLRGDNWDAANRHKVQARIDLVDSSKDRAARQKMNATAHRQRRCDTIPWRPHEQRGSPRATR